MQKLVLLIIGFFIEGIYYLFSYEEAISILMCFEIFFSCRLSHEWQAYISRTHSLRKTFISVKGIYYQVIKYDTILFSVFALVMVSVFAHVMVKIHDCTP